MKTPKLQPKEIEIQHQIQEFLEYQGCLVVRINNAPIPIKGTNSFRRALRRGLPDLMVFIPPKHGKHSIPVFIECKRNPKCKPTPEQERFLGDADLIGVICLVASSVEFVAQELKPYLPNNN